MVQSAQSSSLPVVPMRNAVLFPGVTFPISAGRAGTLRAIEAALSTPERLVFAVAQREDVGDRLARRSSTRSARSPPSARSSAASAACRLVLEGKSRGIALRVAPKNGYLEATVQRRAGDAAARREGRGLRRRSTARPASAPPSSARSAACPRRPSSRSSRRSTSRAGSPTSSPATSTSRSPSKQALLETLSVEERLRRVLVHVQRQIGVLDGAGGHQVARCRRSSASASARCTCASR